VTGVGLLVALCFLAYFPVFHNGFIWDDDHYLTDNPFLNDFEGLKRIWFDLQSRVTCPPKTDPFAMLGFGSKI